jgi:hypothetical protein
MPDKIITDDQEIWKHIPGYEGRYRASNHGRIKATTLGYAPWILKQKRKHNGYLAVLLAGVEHSVHVLVLSAFMGERPYKHDCAHYDGNRSNNHLSNLRWATRKENFEDKDRHGTQVRGEKSPSAKLTWDNVLEIRRVGKTRSLSESAKKYGVSVATIQSVRIGRSWKKPR